MTEKDELRAALEWLTEMAGYAINHLEPEWARKNKAELAHALEQAHAALAAKMASTA